MNHDIYMANSSLLNAVNSTHGLHFSEEHGIEDIAEAIQRARYWMAKTEEYLAAYEASKAKVSA